MMLYIYSGAKSNGARDLTQALDATRLRKFDGMDFWQKNKRLPLKEGDVVVCWGRQTPPIDGIKILNAGTDCDKAKQQLMLANAGVPTIAIRTNAAEGYLPRKLSHVGGDDLLSPPSKADFWAYKMKFVKEFRLHSFSGRSIRAGVKIPRFEMAPSEGEFKREVNTHPWIRSYDGGWKIDYTGFQSDSKIRKIAHYAVKSLGLTFGAVDVGMTEDDRYYVLEVNRAPGLEGGTIDAYVRAITRWVREGGEEVEGVESPKDEETDAPAPSSAVYRTITRNVNPPRSSSEFTIEDRNVIRRTTNRGRIVGILHKPSSIRHGSRVVYDDLSGKWLLDMVVERSDRDIIDEMRRVVETPLPSLQPTATIDPQYITYTQAQSNFMSEPFIIRRDNEV